MAAIESGSGKGGDMKNGDPFAEPFVIGDRKRQNRRSGRPGRRAADNEKDRPLSAGPVRKDRRVHYPGSGRNSRGNKNES